MLNLNYLNPSIPCTFLRFEICYWHFCPSWHSVLSYILFRGRPSPRVHTIHTHAFLNMHQYVEFVTGVILFAIVDVRTLAQYVTKLPTLKGTSRYCVQFLHHFPLQTCNHCMGWSRFTVLSRHRVGVLSYGCSKSASCCVRLQSHHQPQWSWEKSHPKLYPKILQLFQNSF